MALEGVKVLFVDDTRRQLSDRPQFECLQMTQRGAYLGHCRVGGGLVQRRHVAAHDGRPLGVYAGGETLLLGDEGRFDAHASGTGARQDLADLLDRFMVGLNRQLVPRTGRRQTLF